MNTRQPTIYAQIVAQLLIAEGVLSDEARLYLETIMDDVDLDPVARREVRNGVDLDSAVEDRISLLSAKRRAALAIDLLRAEADGLISRANRCVRRARAALADLAARGDEGPEEIELDAVEEEAIVLPARWPIFEALKGYFPRAA